MAFFLPKNVEKHSKSTPWGTPRQMPKSTQKALHGALSGPGPWALRERNSDNQIGKLSQISCHGISQEKQRFLDNFPLLSPNSRVQKISLKFPCKEFSDPGTSRPKSREIPPITCLKRQKKAPCIKVLSGTSRARVRDIPTCGSLMSQEYPARKLYLYCPRRNYCWIDSRKGGSNHF